MTASAGVLLVLHHLFSLALVLGVFAIAAAVGARLLKAGGLSVDDPLEALLFGTGVGLGALATAILGVGLLSAHPIVLLALLGGAAVVGRNELGKLPRLLAGARICLGRADRVSLSIFVVIGVFLISGALAPPLDWDALMYHLTVPQHALRTGVIDLPEDNGYFAFVGLPHMLSLPLLAADGPAGPALVSALCTLGLALAVFAFGLRFLDDRTAGLGLAVLWGSTILVLVGTTARTDTILAFYVFLTHYAVIRATQSHSARYLHLAATVGGMAVGVKYNALLYLAALAPLAAWVVWTRVERRTATIALALGLAAAAAAPWLLKNALLLGDPLYPFLRGARLEPWIAELYGGATVAPYVDPAPLNPVWRLQAPFNLIDFFTAPERIAVEAEGASYHPNLILLLLPLWLLFLRNRVLGWLAAPALAYTVLVVLLQPTTSLRYLIPALAPLTLVALHVYALGADKLLSTRAVRLLLGATALVVLARTIMLLYRQANDGRQLAYALGFLSRDAFLKARAGAYADVVSFVNEQVPQPSRVLLLFEARGYYFRVPVLQDNGIVNWPRVAPRATLPDCLRSAGITHVLLNRGALTSYARRGLDLGPFRLDAFEGFARDCLSAIYWDGGAYAVFRVRGGPAAGAR